MTRLKITPSGLKLQEWNSDFRGECRVKKTSTEFIVTKKDNDEVLGVFSSRDQADEMFWEDKPITTTWQLLRDSVEIEGPVTIETINQMIKDHSDLALFCDKVLHLGDYGFHEDSGIVRAYGEIKSGVLSFRYYLDDVYQDHMRIDETLGIYDEIPNNDAICRGEYSFSLLEVLQAIYGVHQHPITWDKNGLTNDLGERIDDPLPFLLAPVIVGDITVQDVFDLVERNEELKDFIAMYSWCSTIDEYHIEAKKPLHPEVERIFYHTELYRDIEMHPKSYLYKKDGINMGVNYHGVGKPSEAILEDYATQEATPPETITNYALDGSSVNEFAHLPLKVIEEVEIRRAAVYSRKYNIKEEARILCKVKCPMTLLEILDGIYWEISFLGGPSDRNEFIEDLRERVEEVKEGLGEHTKRYEGVDEMLKDLMGEEDYNEMYPPEEGEDE